MKFVFVHDGLFLLGLLEFVVVKVLTGFGGFGLDALLDARDICKSLDFSVFMFFVHSLCKDFLIND